MLDKLLFPCRGAGLVRPLWVANSLKVLTWLILSDFEGRLNVRDCRVEQVWGREVGEVK